MMLTQTLLVLSLLFPSTIARANSANELNEYLDTASPAADREGCLWDVDGKEINRLLSDGGPGTIISLCPRTIIQLTSPIVFTAKSQQISTHGYPTDEEDKAILKLVGGEGGTVVQGDCRRCHSITLASLIIDGSRPTLGRIPERSPSTSSSSSSSEFSGSTSPLVLLGNNGDQQVIDCHIKDPRGWTGLQIREGDLIGCTGAVIKGNVIGPIGEPWVVEVDGDDPDGSVLGRPIASGLSLACLESVVEGNTFVDVTDTSIIIYGSPSSLISSNTILSRTVDSMSGILLSDYSPWEGNYTNTRVINNTIEADEGTLIRVGIGLGTGVLSDDLETILFGGVITGNTFKGYGMGYGIAATGLRDFTVDDNESVARHGGWLGERCRVPLEEDEEVAKGMTEEERERGVVKNPRPVAFLRNEKTIQGGTWQDDFNDAEFFYLVCLDPESDEHDSSLRKEKSPSLAGQSNMDEGDDLAATIERASARMEANKNKKVKDSIMERIISHSQAKMLEAITALGWKVEALVQKANSVDPAKGKARMAIVGDEGAEILAALSHLSSRIATLESERSNTRETLDNFRRELLSLGKNLDRAKTHDEAVLNELATLFSSDQTKSRSIFADAVKNASAVAGDEDWLAPVLYLLGGQAFVGVIVMLWRNKASSRKRRI